MSGLAVSTLHKIVDLRPHVGDLSVIAFVSEQVDFWVSCEDSGCGCDNLGESKPKTGESAQGEAIGSVGHDRRR